MAGTRRPATAGPVTFGRRLRVPRRRLAEVDVNAKSPVQAALRNGCRSISTGFGGLYPVGHLTYDVAAPTSRAANPLGGTK